MAIRQANAIRALNTEEHKARQDSEEVAHMAAAPMLRGQYAQNKHHSFDLNMSRSSNTTENLGQNDKSHGWSTTMVSMTGQ